MEQIGFGGSCHWCTEAIFQSLKGVMQVEQGWIAPDTAPEEFSEAVVVYFDQTIISVETLIEIHLHTHSSTSKHSMRYKYRSAVYCFSSTQAKASRHIIEELQKQFEKLIITQVLGYQNFKLNKSDYLNYYYSDTEKPFCKNIIEPKIRQLIKMFSAAGDLEKLSPLIEHS